MSDASAFAEIAKLNAELATTRKNEKAMRDFIKRVAEIGRDGELAFSWDDLKPIVRRARFLESQP